MSNPIFPQVVLISVGCGCRMQVGKDSQFLMCDAHKGPEDKPPGRIPASVLDAVGRQLVGLGQLLCRGAAEIMATQVVTAVEVPKLIVEP